MALGPGVSASRHSWHVRRLQNLPVQGDAGDHRSARGTLAMSQRAMRAADLHREIGERLSLRAKDSARQRTRAAVRPCGWRAGPGVAHLGAVEHAGQGRAAGRYSPPHPGPRGADGLGNVKDPTFRIPPFAQANRDPEITPRPGGAGNDRIVLAPRRRRARSGVFSHF